MNKKVSLIVIYALLAATYNMNAMDGQESNFLSVSNYQNPSNSPAINQSDSPTLIMKKSFSLEGIEKELLKVSRELKRENDNSSGSRSRSGSVSEEITPRSRSNPSSSREASPIRKYELEKVMLGILSKNCFSTNVYVYRNMEERGNFLCVTFEKDGKKQEIKAAISEQNQDFRFIQACDENGETFFVQLNKPFSSIDDSKESPLSDSSPETSALLKKIDSKPEISIELKMAPKSGDQKGSNRRFHFYVGFSVVAAIVLMYNYNKISDFMAIFMNKMLPGRL